MDVDDEYSNDSINTRSQSRLALLERDRNIKSETADAIRIKRERADTDAGNGRKRSRRSGSIEVVDLTGV